MNEKPPNMKIFSFRSKRIYWPFYSFLIRYYPGIRLGDQIVIDRCLCYFGFWGWIKDIIQKGVKI